LRCLEISLDIAAMQVAEQACRPSVESVEKVPPSGRAPAAGYGTESTCIAPRRSV
jgi:hypothetical protein